MSGWFDDVTCENIGTRVEHALFIHLLRHEIVGGY